MEKSIEVIFVFIKNRNGSERFVNDWISNGLGHFSSLHPNISMQILHTVLYRFLKVLTRRICLTIKSFFSWWSFPSFSAPYRVIQWWKLKRVVIYLGWWKNRWRIHFYFKISHKCKHDFLESEQRKTISTSFRPHFELAHFFQHQE